MNAARFPGEIIWLDVLLNLPWVLTDIDTDASKEDCRDGLFPLFWCLSEKSVMLNLLDFLQDRNISLQVECNTQNDLVRFTLPFKSSKSLLNASQIIQNCYNCFHWTLHSLCTWVLPPSAAGDYIPSCQKFTSLICHRGNGGTLKKIARWFTHICTSIKATSVLWFGSSTVVSGDKLLETVTCPGLVSSKPRPVSKLVDSWGWWSSSTSHQMDAAFEIHRTSLKICPLCFTVVNLWGPRNIT